MNESYSGAAGFTLLDFTYARADTQTLLRQRQEVQPSDRASTRDSSALEGHTALVRRTEYAVGTVRNLGVISA